MKRARLLQRLFSIQKKAESEVEPVKSDKLELLEKAEHQFLQPSTFSGKVRLAWAKITELTMRKSVPSFDRMTINDNNELCFLTYPHHLDSPFFWTPLIQLIDPSEELLEQLEDLKVEDRKTKKSKSLKTDRDVIDFHNRQSRQLVKAVVEDSIQDSGFDYLEDYYCRPSLTCSMHGVVDFVLFDRANEKLNYGYPVCPIYIMKAEKNLHLGKIFFAELPTPVGGIAQWYIQRLHNLMAHDKEFAERVKSDERLSNIRVIFTNGHLWRLYEIDIDFRVRSTKFFEPRSVAQILREVQDPIFEGLEDKAEKKTWNDFKHMQLCLGLVRFGLNTPNEAEAKLDETYRLLVDLQFHDVMTPEDKREVRRRSKLARYLPKFMREWYVGVDLSEPRDDAVAKK